MKKESNIIDIIKMFIEKIKSSATAKFIWALFCVLALVSSALFGIVEGADRLEIDVLSAISKPTIVCFLIVCVAALVWIIIKMALADRKSERLGADATAKKQDDSIIELLKETATLNYNREVIQIGAALRQSTCLKNRNDLRIKIGEYVRAAARNCADVNSEAVAYIEDIGNTYIEHGDAENAISKIELGIEIIESHIRKLEGRNLIDEKELNDARFIAVRGHRNMANCFSWKRDVEKANNHINSAENHINLLTDEEVKLEALADLEYSKSKISRAQTDWRDAITHLCVSIEYYEKLCTSYSSEENQKKRIDSTTKNLRELADLHYVLREPGKAEEYLQEGLKRAYENRDFDNCVRMHLIQARIAIELHSDITAAQIAMEQARRYMDLVDSKRIIKMYEEVWEEIGKKDGQKSNHKSGEAD